MRLLLLFFLFLYSCTIYKGPNGYEEKVSQTEKKSVVTDLKDIIKKVPVDEFNYPDKKTIPKEGGKIVIRTKAEPRMLSPIISNESPVGAVIGLVSDSLIIRDPETFEWLPWIAHTWEVKDKACIKNKCIEGYFDGNIFYQGPGVIVTLPEYLNKRGDKTFIFNKVINYNFKVKKNFYTVELIPISNPIRLDKNYNILKSSVYIFYIREGVSWHDFHPFDARDVVFSYNVIMNPFVDAAHLRNYYIDVEKVTLIDNYTVRFDYKKQYFLSLSFCGGIPLIPRHRYKIDSFKGDQKSFAEFFNTHPDNWKPLGTGPYLFESWEKGKFIRLVKNKNYFARRLRLPYFDPKRPYIDVIEYRLITNDNVAIKELTSGNIDADFEVTPEIWFDSRTNTEDFQNKIVRAKYITPLYAYIGWNLKRPFFQDPRVRVALSHLVPKKKILDEIHKGLGEVVTGPFFINSPMYDSTIEAYDYDPVKARQMLKEAGWVDHDGDGIRDKDGINFEFEYLVHNARDYHKKIADIIKESFEEAGIRVNIRVIDWTVFAKTVSEGNFDAVRFAWGTGIDTDPYQVWHSSQINGGSNFISFANPEVDRLLEEARREFDQQKRWEMYRRLHRILHELQPYTFLFSFHSLGFYSRKIRGVKFYIGGPSITEWYIDE